MKTPDGKEGDLDYSCMTWSAVGVSLMPNPKAKNTSATVKGLIKQLFTARKAIRKDMYSLMEKRDFKEVTTGTREELLVNAMSSANESYGKAMHSFIYGSDMSTTNLLALGENKWLADWPDVVVDTYSSGLKGKDKDGAEPAEESLSKRAQILTFERDLAKLKDDEANADEKIKRVPESKRASEKEKLLTDIADKRKSIVKRKTEWQKDADALEKKVKL